MFPGGLENCPEGGPDGGPEGGPDDGPERGPGGLEGGPDGCLGSGPECGPEAAPCGPAILGLIRLPAEFGTGPAALNPGVKFCVMLPF